MKRITLMIILALAAAVVLPGLTQAQVHSRSIGRHNIWGGGYEPPYASSFGGGSVSNTLADDISTDLHVDVTNDPILGCSGLDIKHDIQALLDLDGLADDLKNYLKSFLAKQALSLVYASPQIAGVLDGLKAFGNARFNLAQTSCEAIEGEISAQSRYLRQQAFEECLAKKRSEGAENALMTCSTETGSFAAGLEEFVNSGTAAARGKLNNWISRLNVGGVNSVAGICEGLGDNKPRACTDNANASQLNAFIGETQTNPDGSIFSVDAPLASPAATFDEAARNAAGAGGTRVLAMMSVVASTRGDIDGAMSLLNEIIRERKAAYASAMGATGGKMMAGSVNSIYDRERGQNIFIGAARQMTVKMAADIEQHFPGIIASEFEEGGISPVHTDNSFHYRGQAIDFNYQGPDEVTRLNELYDYLNSRRGEFGIVELIGPKSGRADHQDHLHVAFGDNGATPVVGGVSVFSNEALAKEIQDALTGLSADATRANKLSAMRTAMAKVPLLPEDACYYELDGITSNGLENIADSSKIFSANAVANALAAKAARASKGESQRSENTIQSIQNSSTAILQNANLSIGRASLCMFITNVPPVADMMTQYLNGEMRRSYLIDQANNAAHEASLLIYDGVMHQVRLARAMANTDVANPNIDRGFQITLDDLQAARASIERTQRAPGFDTTLEKLNGIIQSQARDNATDRR